MKKRGSRKRIRKKLIVAVSAALAVLVAAAGLLYLAHDRGTPLGVSLLPAGEKLPMELLIKGCLFDLGLSEKDVRFSGSTVQVNFKSPLSREEISRAFSALEDAGEVRMVGEGHVQVISGKSRWDIRFSRPPAGAARCAIIVDDMGLNLKWAKALSAIDADLTFSVLPDRPFSVRAARYLHGQGREVLLHLPMEGNGMDPGKGAIYRNMSRTEILSVLRRNLEIVPHVKGVNNHMGSRVTPDQDIMRVVLKEIGDRGLFFVDSLTTSASVCRSVAGEVGLPFVARDVFLDNERNDPYITAQIDRLVRIALKHSQAVAICHPYPETIAVLEREIPRIKQRGVEIVPVSMLVRPVGREP
ncbi:MAG: divergent polysaccharide deacetylase family protein [Desulfomonilia bacterium]|jgi:polysaccharide deacetylase 2 family uncharacterized protein YibQ